MVGRNRSLIELLVFALATLYGDQVKGQRMVGRVARTWAIIIIIIFIIIIIIIIVVVISLMQGIYTHIPETDYVPREYSVADILLLFMVRISLVSVLNLLYFYISTLQSMCAVPNMAVFCNYYYYYSALKILVIKPEGKWPFGSRQCNWESRHLRSNVRHSPLIYGRRTSDGEFFCYW